MTDRWGVVAKRAENLMPGVPYVRGWAQARRSAGTLAEQLTALGLESDFPGLTADVNVSGDGLVRLGSIRPEAALMLAELITSGLTAETATPVDTGGGRDDDCPSNPVRCLITATSKLRLVAVRECSCARSACPVRPVSPGG